MHACIHTSRLDGSYYFQIIKHTSHRTQTYTWLILNSRAFRPLGICLAAHIKPRYPLVNAHVDVPRRYPRRGSVDPLPWKLQLPLCADPMLCHGVMTGLKCTILPPVETSGDLMKNTRVSTMESSGADSRNRNKTSLEAVGSIRAIKGLNMSTNVGYT